MSDLIERQAAIDAVAELQGRASSKGELTGISKAWKKIKQLPSAQSGLITWLLDEIWDEDMWELNWQAFPELLCRKLEKLGYVKRKGDEYERLDQQTGCD